MACCLFWCGLGVALKIEQNLARYYEIVWNSEHWVYLSHTAKSQRFPPLVQLLFTTSAIRLIHWSLSEPTVFLFCNKNTWGCVLLKALWKLTFRVELGNMNLLLILWSDFVGFRKIEICLMSLLETCPFGLQQLYPVVPQNMSKVFNILYTVCTVMSENSFRVLSH